MTSTLPEDQTKLLLNECLQNLNIVLAKPPGIPVALGAGADDGRVAQEALRNLSGLAERLLAEVRNRRLTLSIDHTRVLLAVAGQMRQAQDGAAPASDSAFTSRLQELHSILEQHRQSSARTGVAASPVCPAPVAVATSERLRVLVVDDDQSCSILLKGLASKFGDCEVVVNGKEAVEAFRSAQDAGQGFHLICMDVHMPELGGQEAVTQIRAIEQRKKAAANGVKILMTTSSSDVNTILAMYGAKCDGYMVKPFDGKQLEERLKSLGLLRTTRSD